MSVTFSVPVALTDGQQVTCSCGEGQGPYFETYGEFMAYREAQSGEASEVLPGCTDSYCQAFPVSSRTVLQGEELVSLNVSNVNAGMLLQVLDLPLELWGQIDPSELLERIVAAAVETAPSSYSAGRFVPLTAVALQALRLGRPVTWS